MSRYIIIGNGEIDNLEILKSIIVKNDIIIAVDGGYDHIKKISMEPDYLIGDMDSIKILPQNNPSIKVIKFPKEKDKTDTQIAIEFALKNKVSEILLFGMTSISRIDHSLNNIFLLEALAEKRIKNTLFVNNLIRLSAAKEQIKIYSKYGLLVSLIPLSRRVKGISTTGLKYKLKKDTLYRDKSRGISNIMISKEANITFEAGVLLVTQIIEKPD